MKVTLRWLAEYVDLPTDDPQEVAKALESLGHEVESIEILEPQFSGVVVVRVTAVRPHPNADRLRLARVTTGTDETEVVCGAWNFEAGDVVALAPPGSRLAGDLQVDTREIRGIASPGMICSERELGLGDDHQGILVLDPAVPVGSDFGDLVPLPDAVYDLSITTNRPDAMGIVGLARDLAALYEVPLRVPMPTLDESGAPCDVTVRLEDPAGCPRYVARLVRDVTVGPSPLWMQIRLRAVGVRPINNVVDATNYVLMELGHPTHAFDRSALGDTIVVRRARDGERLKTLDDVDRELLTDDLMIADATVPVAFAGVMGGEATEVGDGTTSVLIEAAYFEPVSILLTSKRHGLRTEASARFERGMDPNAADLAAARVAELCVQFAGGTAAPGTVDAYPEPIAPLVLQLPSTEPSRLLGFDLSRDEAAALLERLGFQVDASDPITVTVPTRRPDIDRPVDLIEEIARLHGYDKIPETVAIGPGGGLPVHEQRYRKLRRVLVGAGYAETLSMVFMSDGDLDDLALPAGHPLRSTVAVLNPLREEERLLRTTLLPGLLRAAARNAAHSVADIALFETGKTFLGAGDGRLPEQPETLAYIAVGSPEPAWYGDGGAAADALDATGLWALVARAMDLGDFGLRQAAPAGFHPGRAAEILIDGEVAGVVGEIHPGVAEAFGIEGRVAAGEVRIEQLLTAPALWQFRAPSSFPPVIFDLAFEVDVTLPAGDLLGAIRDSAGAMLEHVVVFDVFAGPPLAAGKKSIAVRLTYRAPDRTMTDEEAAPLRRDIATAVGDRLGGTLRGAGT